jgi:hypothetical protein
LSYFFATLHCSVFSRIGCRSMHQSHVYLLWVGRE